MSTYEDQKKDFLVTAGLFADIYLTAEEYDAVTKDKRLSAAKYLELSMKEQREACYFFYQDGKAIAARRMYHDISDSELSATVLFQIYREARKTERNTRITMICVLAFSILSMLGAIIVASYLP